MAGCKKNKTNKKKTVNEHGTHRVTIIIEKLVCIINIISGVSYPGLGSSIYGLIIDGPRKAANSNVP